MKKIVNVVIMVSHIVVQDNIAPPLAIQHIYAIIDMEEKQTMTARVVMN